MPERRPGGARDRRRAAAAGAPADQPLRRLWRYAAAHRRTVVLASVLSVLNKVFDVFPEILIGVAIGRVTLSREQLLINQRISQAAVRRVNALRQRLGDLDAGDIRLGALTAATLDTEARFAFAAGLPAEGAVSTRFRPLRVAPAGRGDPAG